MSFTTGVLVSAVSLLVPLLLAALGELVAERAGVINIGLEGMMVAGGYAGFTVMLHTGNAWLGGLAGVGGGLLVAAVMALVSVYGRANQIVTGFALFLMVPGVVDFLYAQETAELATVPSTPHLDSLAVPLLHELPLVGEALFDQNGFWYVLVGLAVIVVYTVRRTRFGLELAACGYDPESAATQGVHVLRVRALATLWAGALAGLGGAALTVGTLGAYSQGVMAGRGFIAIAIVILGRWRPGWVIPAAAIVALSDALRLRLGESVDVPVQLIGLLPWLVVLVLLVLGARAMGRMPKALGRTVV